MKRKQRKKEGIKQRKRFKIQNFKSRGQWIGSDKLFFFFFFFFFFFLWRTEWKKGEKKKGKGKRELNKRVKGLKGYGVIFSS